MQSAIDIVTEAVIESVKVSGKPIPSTIEAMWEHFNLTDEELATLAKRELSSMVRERLTGGTHQSKAEVLPPTRSITVTSSPIDRIHVRVRFVTDEIVYKSADGTRKPVMEFRSVDFDYLLGRIGGVMRGLQRHQHVIDSTKLVLAEHGVSTMGDLPENEKLAVDQLWKSVKQLDAPALEASVA